jgi:hypothetical protein
MAVCRQALGAHNKVELVCLQPEGASHPAAAAHRNAAERSFIFTAYRGDARCGTHRGGGCAFAGCGPEGGVGWRQEGCKHQQGREPAQDVLAHGCCCAAVLLDRQQEGRRTQVGLG